MPKVGDVIGRFTLEKELGRGPMSEVFLAVEEETLWKAAFKFFVLEPGSKPADRALWAERMLREARAAAAFEHERTVRVHEVGERDGAPYLMRDFIEGRSLSDFVGDRSPGALGRKLGWLRDLAITLADIHRAGLVHRDVKPTSVLIRRDGALRVLDFGVARRSIDRAAGISVPRTDRLRSDGSVPRIPVARKQVHTERMRVLGTPAYMAPERLANLGTSPLGDQFAWGVLAFELLAGRLPWGSGKKMKPVAVIEAILTEEAPGVRLFAPELSPAMGGLLARAMAKDPGGRFPSMDLVARAFEDATR